VSKVGLFVNAPAEDVFTTLACVPLDLLQFHGDEDADYCAQFGRPWIKAIRMRPDTDLLECAAMFAEARALLLDAFVEGYGGGGQAFDWSLIPESLPMPIVLSGGLHPSNVAAAVRAVRPWAVDVSSGVEVVGGPKGIKDPLRIKEFIAGVQDADAGSTV
jgi:phosphoribosylanthranilate isomerase